MRTTTVGRQVPSAMRTKSTEFCANRSLCVRISAKTLRTKRPKIANLGSNLWANMHGACWGQVQPSVSLITPSCFPRRSLRDMVSTQLIPLISLSITLLTWRDALVISCTSYRRAFSLTHTSWPTTEIFIQSNCQVIQT